MAPLLLSDFPEYPSNSTSQEPWGRGNHFRSVPSGHLNVSRLRDYSTSFPWPISAPTILSGFSAIYQLITNFFLSSTYQPEACKYPLILGPEFPGFVLRSLCIFKPPPSDHRIVKEGPPVFLSYRGIWIFSSSAVHSLTFLISLFFFVLQPLQLPTDGPFLFFSCWIWVSFLWVPMFSCTPLTPVVSLQLFNACVRSIVKRGLSTIKWEQLYI